MCDAFTLFRFHFFCLHHIQSFRSRILISYPLLNVLFLHLPGSKKNVFFCSKYFQEWSHSTLDLQFVGSETAPTSEEAMPMDPVDMESGPPDEPELRFRLAQVTPVMGPTSGGVATWNFLGGLRTRCFLLQTAGAH